MKIINKKKYTILSFLTSSVFILILAFSISTALVSAGTPCTIKDAQGKYTLPAGCDPNIKSDGTGISPNSDGTGVNNGTTVSPHIKNPLGEGHLEDIPSFIQAILEIVLDIGVPIVALAIIYSGFLFVSAQGNSEKLKKAKQSFVYTVIGAAILLGCYVIAHAIKGTVDEIRNSQ